MTGFTVLLNILLQSLVTGISLRENLLLHIIPGFIGIVLTFFAGKYNDMYRENEKLIEKYELSQYRIRKLASLIPICSFCKSVKLDPGEWMVVEDFLKYHIDDELKFTHGVCNDCLHREIRAIDQIT